ncbi:MAG: protoheme IX farnesyltransferase [Desulfuromonadales bacterium]
MSGGDILRLLRWRLALLNGMAATCGYLLYPSGIDLLQLVAVYGGTALLAAAGSTFNQVLEQDLDCVMERTKGRPLPSRVMSVSTAFVIGAACLFCGLLCLGRTGGAVPPLIGVVTLVWYLAVYTPLKRRTALALPIGALCGAAAPLIGWTLAGGACADHRILLIAGVMYLWQVPHFWLLQRRHRDDYRAAGIPLCEIATGDGRIPLCALWIIALAAGTMLLPVVGIIPQIHAIWCVLFFLPLLLSFLARSEKTLFACFNLFPLLLTLMIWL